MTKKLVSLFLILTLICTLTGCQAFQSKPASNNSNNDSKPFVIVTSFYPLYIMALNITRDVPGVELVNMTPLTTTGCLHDYQLNPQDLITLQRADVFVVNGAGMESFLDRVVQEHSSLKIITAAEGIPLIKNPNGEDNPHVWVSLEGAIAETANIARQLASLDPSRADCYLQNQASYTKKLEDLRRAMKSDLADLKERNIVTFHEAFPYFASDFGLNVVAVLEEEPGSEPSPREITSIIDKITATKTRLLFTEPQYPGTSAQVIARETGAKVFVLDPVVTGPSDPDAYINIMRNNLTTLKEALK